MEDKSRNTDAMTSMSHRHTQHPVVRAAVYVRKSSEEGLEMEYNSLDAQRDAGRAYIQSQPLICPSVDKRHFAHPVLET